MDKEIYFCRIGNGQNKDGNAFYYIEYVNLNGAVKRDYFQDANEFENVRQKIKNKDLFLKKIVGLIGITMYDRTYIKDIRV